MVSFPNIELTNVRTTRRPGVLWTATFGENTFKIYKKHAPWTANFQFLAKSLIGITTVSGKHCSLIA